MGEFNLKDYKFERTVWANIQLAKLCPGNNIQKFTEVLSNEDTAKQLTTLIEIAVILNEAYERKACHLDPNHEKKLISREMLLDLDENTLSDVCMAALGQYAEDGKTTVDAEPKKEEAEENESISPTAGSSTSAT